MKKVLKNLGFSLALVAHSALAVPTLYFDGALDYFYDNSTGIGELNVNATLLGSMDVPDVDIRSSELTLTAFFDYSADLGNATAGVFSKFAPEIDDPVLAASMTYSPYMLSVSDSSGNLLGADFDQLYMIGRNDNDYGTLRGAFSASEGALADFFSDSDLIALEFNLSTLFGNNMFGNSFSGRVNGKLTGTPPQSVPEPGILALLGIGLLMIGAVRKTRQQQS